MKSLLGLLAVFGAAVALVLIARVDTGVVLFFYPPWRVEMSLIFFAVAAAVSFAVLYFLFRLLGNALGLPRTVRAWRARRRRERAHAALAAALRAQKKARGRDVLWPGAVEVAQCVARAGEVAILKRELRPAHQARRLQAVARGLGAL